MFRKLLIANRGEIACRIMRTAKRLGIATVAVYSDADSAAQHVKHADEAIYLGPSAPESSYLNQQAIINAAQQTGAEAIHPGYGFLSENSQFAKRCQDHALVFIGPSIQALDVMGSKQQAKACLEKTAVPLIPGYHGVKQTAAALLTAAQAIGLPLLIKAAAGGGGKGMRVVTDLNELSQAIEATKREAKAYFGDETLILEKFIPKARHVEVQLMGDTHGHIVALFDRDCSIQRRHQKILEEAPAPFLSAALRTKLYHAACAVGQAIHYTNAGTIEFLVEPNEHFYFMEMNTRLQVEHPVTEAITGIDLVEWQLRIATGEPLPAAWSTLTPQGHAIECRIYAEDPSHNFLPSTGQLILLSTPSGEGIRLDSGYESKDILSPYYDPMLAKLITHGRTREEAIQLMQQALKQYCIAGISSNLSFLQTLIAQPDFIQGQLATDFLETHPLQLEPPAPSLPVFLLLFAYDVMQAMPSDPIEQDCFGWHPFLTRTWERAFCFQGEVIAGTLSAQANEHSNGCRIVVGWAKEPGAKLAGYGELPGDVPTAARGHSSASDGPSDRWARHPGAQSHQDAQRGAPLPTLRGSHSITITQATPHLIIQTEDAIYQGEVFFHNHQWTCFYEGNTYLFTAPQHASSTLNTQHAHTAPMPGTVVALLKQKGDAIEADEGVMIIEAMKMEHTIRAAHTGCIDDIFFQPGDQVTEGTELFSLKDTHDPKTSDAH
ncbi:MAG: acetyl-CoA carboxylase biotin carboxylase subunit [Gammaproteobacteria bacterium]|nr:acetyl-CoA carboxylase biotin carboxylase subunit [Gammaproteobacteria bacterium]